MCKGILLWLICLASMRADEGRIVVATYNVRNYLSMDRRVEGKFRSDYPKPESEKQVVRESIRQVAPDILTLQEIGDNRYLEELRSDLGREGLNYERSALLEASDENRRVAALWREGLAVEVVEHADLKIKYFGGVEAVKRGMLELRVGEKGEQWSLFVLHLKSKYTDNKADFQSAKRRALEARAARDRILEIYPDPASARFLVLGDMNDTPNTSPFRAFEKRGSKRIAEAVPCFDDTGHTWTHFYKKEDTYSRVDLIFRSVGWTALENLEGAILSRRDFYEGSDHRLVWVAFESAQ
ncbi:MAG: endonuclease/exonuclease/phosphatase family protein [Verrucomicrobiota bacterium]